MIAAKSHSMSSREGYSDVIEGKAEGLTFIEIGFVEIIGSRDVHVIQTCDLSPINP